MPRRIKVKINSRTGKVTVKREGFEGDQCLETVAFEERLGALESQEEVNHGGCETCLETEGQYE
jgi:hypothetical protein